MLPPAAAAASGGSVGQLWNPTACSCSSPAHTGCTTRSSPASCTSPGPKVHSHQDHSKSREEKPCPLALNTDWGRLGDHSSSHSGSSRSTSSRCPVEVAGLRCLGSHLDSISLQLCLQPSLSGGAAPGVPVFSSAEGGEDQRLHQQHEQQQQLQASCPLGSQRQPFACFGDFVGCLKGLLESAVQAGPFGCNLRAIAKQLLQLLDEELLLLLGRVAGGREGSGGMGEGGRLNDMETGQGPIPRSQGAAAAADGAPLAHHLGGGVKQVGEGCSSWEQGLPGEVAAAALASAAGAATSAAAEGTAGGAAAGMQMEPLGTGIEFIAHDTPEARRWGSESEAQGFAGWAQLQKDAVVPCNSGIEGKRVAHVGGFLGSCKRARMSNNEATGQDEVPWCLDSAAPSGATDPPAAVLPSASTAAAALGQTSRGVGLGFGRQGRVPEGVRVEAAAVAEATECGRAFSPVPDEALSPADPKYSLEPPSSGLQQVTSRDTNSSSWGGPRAQAIARVQAFCGTLEAGLVAVGSRQGFSLLGSGDALQGGAGHGDRSQSPCCCDFTGCTLARNMCGVESAAAAGAAAGGAVYCSVAVQSSPKRQPPYVAKRGHAAAAGDAILNGSDEPGMDGRMCYAACSARAAACTSGTAATVHIPLHPFHHQQQGQQQQQQAAKQPFQLHSQQQLQQQKSQLPEDGGQGGQLQGGGAGLTGDDVLMALGEPYLPLGGMHTLVRAEPVAMHSQYRGALVAW